MRLARVEERTAPNIRELLLTGVVFATSLRRGNGSSLNLTKGRYGRALQAELTHAIVELHRQAGECIAGG